MRVAALYDIHGNIDALDAVLDELEAESIDLIVVGGDLVWGPHPAETVARVQGLAGRVEVIRGNADREVVHPEWVEPGWITEVSRWCHEQLDPPARRFLWDLPETTVVRTGKVGEVLFCHATPRSDEEIITAMTPEDSARPLFIDVSQNVVVCGHTHSQFDRLVAGHRVVNAGSVGLPYEDALGAYWAIIDDDVELRRTEYDFGRAAERIRATACPYADGFAENIVSPPSRAEGTESFEQRRRTPTA